MAQKKPSRHARRKQMFYTIAILAVAGLILSPLLGYILGRSSLAQPGSGNDISYFEGVVSRLEEALKEDPDNVNNLVELGNAYYQLALAYSAVPNEQKTVESFARAVEPYGKALELDPENVNVRVDRAVAAFYSNNPVLAEQEFETAIQQDPTHAKAYFNYGVFLLYGVNRPADAISRWETVIELNPASELAEAARNWIAVADEIMRTPPDFDTTPQGGN